LTQIKNGRSAKKEAAPRTGDAAFEELGDKCMAALWLLFFESDWGDVARFDLH
jgi:hypothetical protein